MQVLRKCGAAPPITWKDVGTAYKNIKAGVKMAARHHGYIL